MAEESLREEDLNPGEKQPFARTVELPPYEPDATAYDVDAADDPYRKLTEAIEAGATIQLSLPCTDGRREILELDRTESQAWIREPLRERIVFANGKIRERRATVAITAAWRLSGRAVIEHKDLKPDEEAFMREFGLLEDALVPLVEGGYEKKLRLRESTVSRALSNLREDGFWDGGFDDASAFGYDAPTDREYLPLGGPMGQQQSISDVWDAQAKCLDGATVIPLLDGSNPTLRELTERTEPFWLYACDGEKVVPALAHSARSSGVKHVVDVVIDTGEVVRCTDDHKFMLRFGGWREAKDLRPGDRLMPLYRKLKGRRDEKNTYEFVYHPGLDLWEATHRLVARHAHHDAYFSTQKRHIDHIDENTADNRPENLQVLTQSEHMRKTGRDNWSKRRDSMMAALAKGRTPESYLKKSASRRRWWENLTDEQRAEISRKQSEAQKRSPKSRENQLRLAALGTVAAAAARAQIRSEKALNHTVIEVRDAGQTETFDLTTERYHNFAIGAGIFVHNSYFAWTHDPAIHFALELVSDFVLGRSFSIIATSEKVQKVIDEFINRELLPQSQQSVTPWGPGRITNRLHDMATSLWRDGETFVRKFPLGDGRTKVRTLPAETIWEIITDSEDPLDVYFYVQRYQTRVILFAPASIPAAQTRYIERWIARDEMIHTLINAKESDARGRGDPYASLGWAKRLRDYFDATIQNQYAKAAYQWWFKVNGGVGDVQRLASTAIPSSRPRPGSYMMTNDQVEVNSLSSGVRGSVSGEGTAYDALINHIALAFGLNKSYFGVDSRANRATALVATEPTAKHMETRQDLIIAFLTKLIGDVIVEAAKYKLIPPKEDLSFKVKLPSIIKADANTRGEMIRKAEGMAYLSKQSAAEEYMSEAEFPDFDFDDEQKKIKTETGQDGKKVIMKDVEMVEKGIPTAQEPAWPPGTVANPDGGAQPTNGHSNGVATAPGPDPHNASVTSATGAAKVRDELGRGGSYGGDRSTMESDAAFREECKRRGAMVLYPD